MWNLAAQESRNSEYRPLLKHDRAEIKLAKPLTEKIKSITKPGSNDSSSYPDINSVSMLKFKTYYNIALLLFLPQKML